MKLLMYGSHLHWGESDWNCDIIDHLQASLTLDSMIQYQIIFKQIHNIE